MCTSVSFLLRGGVGEGGGGINRIPKSPYLVINNSSTVLFFFAAQFVLYKHLQSGITLFALLPFFLYCHYLPESVLANDLFHPLLNSMGQCNDQHFPFLQVFGETANAWSLSSHSGLIHVHPIHSVHLPQGFLSAVDHLLSLLREAHVELSLRVSLAHLPTPTQTGGSVSVRSRP